MKKTLFLSLLITTFSANAMETEKVSATDVIRTIKNNLSELSNLINQEQQKFIGKIKEDIINLEQQINKLGMIKAQENESYYQNKINSLENLITTIEGFRKSINELNAQLEVLLPDNLKKLNDNISKLETMIRKLLKDEQSEYITYLKKLAAYLSQNIKAKY